MNSAQQHSRFSGVPNPPCSFANSLWQPAHSRNCATSTSAFGRAAATGNGDPPSLLTVGATNVIVSVVSVVSVVGVVFESGSLAGVAIPPHRLFAGSRTNTDYKVNSTASDVACGYNTPKACLPAAGVARSCLYRTALC